MKKNIKQILCMREDKKERKKEEEKERKKERESEKEQVQHLRMLADREY